MNEWKGMVRMGRTSQRKGRSGELEICHIFQAHGIPAEPGQAVSYGSTPDVIGIPGIHPEIKRVERLNVPEAMAQAIRDSEKFQDGTPTLFHRRNRSPWLVTLRLEDWIDLYKRGEGYDRREQEKAVLDATNIQDGKVDMSDQTISASIMNETEEKVK